MTYAVFLALSGKIKRQIWLCFQKATCTSVTLEPFDAVEAKLFALLVSALLTNNVVIVSLVQQNLENTFISSCWTSGKI